MNDADAQPRPLFHIRIDRELAHPQVLALLREHLAGMHAHSPPDKVHALDLSGLRAPEITFLTAWRRAPGSLQGTDNAHSNSDFLGAMSAIKELAPRFCGTGLFFCTKLSPVCLG